MEDWLKQLKDDWNKTADSDWYKSLRTDERINELVSNPESAFHPAVYEILKVLKRKVNKQNKSEKITNSCFWSF